MLKIYKHWMEILFFDDSFCCNKNYWKGIKKGIIKYYLRLVFVGNLISFYVPPILYECHTKKHWFVKFHNHNEMPFGLWVALAHSWAYQWLRGWWKGAELGKVSIECVLERWRVPESELGEGSPSPLPPAPCGASVSSCVHRGVPRVRSGGGGSRG